MTEEVATRIRERINELESEDIEPVGIGIHPSDFQELKDKYARYQSDESEPRLFGVRVEPSTAIEEGSFKVYHGAGISAEKVCVPTPEQVENYVEESHRIGSQPDPAMARTIYVGRIRIGLRVQKVEFDFVDDAEELVEEKNLWYRGEIEDRVEQKNQGEEWSFDFRNAVQRSTVTDEAKINESIDHEKEIRESMKNGLREAIDKAVARGYWQTDIVAHPQDNPEARGIKIGEKREYFDYVMLKEPRQAGDLA